MRLLYVGTESGTCLSRFQEIGRLNADVRFLATDPYLYSVPRWRQHLEALTFLGPGTVRANAALLQAVREYDPDVVWIDKSTWVWPSTLRTIKARGARLVHFFTDALFPRHRRTHWIFTVLRRTLPLYDVTFTSNVIDYEWMLARGIGTEFSPLGYDDTRFDGTPLPADVQRAWSSEIQFIGHREARTERGILALAGAHLPVRVFGGGWHRAQNKAALAGVAQYRFLSDEEYVCALKAAKIGLCFVSEMNYNQTSGRSFEIPACGTFLLAQRTREHEDAYVEGVEAEFFGDVDELIDKARYYLAHDAERDAIARRGHERCVKSGYSWARYTRDNWRRVERLVAEGGYNRYPAATASR